MFKKHRTKNAINTEYYSITPNFLLWWKMTVWEKKTHLLFIYLCGGRELQYLWELVKLDVTKKTAKNYRVFFQKHIFMNVHPTTPPEGSGDGVLPNQCPNCLIKLSSPKSFKSHQSVCLIQVCYMRLKVDFCWIHSCSRWIVLGLVTYIWWVQLYLVYLIWDLLTSFDNLSDNQWCWFNFICN